MALSADRNTPTKLGTLLAFPVAASTTIYAGALVAANASGFVVPGAAATTLTYLGRAEEYVDNSAGANGDVTVLVRRGQPFKFANSGTDPVVQASLGKPCYIEDDETVAKTDDESSLSVAGIVVGLDADGVWVE
ncbi:hypothetical protein [Zhongshania aliphaticivorans]|uniref:hypothetical protein n=1 Tax=Zhongshania aliphaticivorans TaxID=1470434 RepID=UPI0012E4A00C|nr:hypothetical protein [Zhongshania aliphaticivorans]CAA0103524.1 Uncharacterised protein [Zhongshania aliphaticivorans]